jgi:acyl dehydratase
MPVNPDAVGFTTEPITANWNSKDCLLYAVGVGAGVTDPTGFELEFTTENSQDVTQKVLPTFPVVVPGGGGAIAAAGKVNPAMIVHGEQAVRLHGPLPVTGSASLTSTLTAIWDKGSGAVFETETVAKDATSGAPLWTTNGAIFVRGEGGFGGERGPSRNVAFPDREPDHTVTYGTRTDQALLYRLNGDRNPLHSDPQFAARAGFPKPILHGLCTYGFTGRALLHTVCGSDPARFAAMSARFSKPVYPGQDLTIMVWDLGGGQAVFRTSTEEGVVIDGGTVTYVQ